MNYQTRSLTADRTLRDFGVEALPLRGNLSGAPEHVLEPVRPAVRSLEKRRLQCYVLMMLGDLAALALGFMIASMIVNGAPSSGEAMRQAQLVAPMFLTVSLYNGAYSLAALKSPMQSVARALKALALAAGAVLLVAFFTKTGAYFSRLTFAFGVLATGGTLLAARYLMGRVTRMCCGARVENVLIVDDGGPILNVEGAYHIDAAAQGLRPDLSDPHMQDLLGCWFAPMDRVIVAARSEDRIAWSMTLKGLAVEGEIIDDAVADLGALGARQDGGHGLLLVSHRPLSLRERAMKRGLDLALTLPALIVLSPVMVVVALLIRMEDGGPALFVQNRTGRASRFFRIFKFRSMRADQSDAHGDRSTARTDGRVTRVGRFIRRTSIDELPQLLNVVLGDMSLVGPRPHAIGSQAGNKLFWEVDNRYWQRHTLKPGLTGLAQIRGYRGATECEDDLLRRLQSDLEYLDGWTIWRDIGILLATVRVVIHERAF